MEEAIRILVVDDEPDIRRICRILLETGGYTVLEAATGAEAVEPAFHFMLGRARGGDLRRAAHERR